MDRQENSEEYSTIDLLQILKSLWHNAWIIVLSGILAAAAGFSIAAFLIAPTYSSSIMLYVNNKSLSVGSASFSISSSDITAAQSLVKTYGEILNNRTTLEEIIDAASVPYTFEELSKMITSEPSNNTEIMKVTVVSEDPNEAARIANCIAELLPERIKKIIEGASMVVVDSAVPNPEKIAPSITKYTAVGLLLGVVASVLALSAAAVMDDTIHDEEYVLRTFDYPILAKIPSLLNANSRHYGGYYYESSHRSSK